MKGPSLTSKGVENKLMRRWLVVIRLEARVELAQVRVGLGLGLLGGMCGRFGLQSDQKVERIQTIQFFLALYLSVRGLL